MTDTEAEKIGREWAAKRGRVPVCDSVSYPRPSWHWSPYVDGAYLPRHLSSTVYGLLDDWPGCGHSSESAAYVALGRAVVRGREVFE